MVVSAAEGGELSVTKRVLPARIARRKGPLASSLQSVFASHIGLNQPIETLQFVRTYHKIQIMRPPLTGLLSQKCQVEHESCD